MKFLKIGALTVMLYNGLSLNFHPYLWVKFGIAVLYNTLSGKQDLSGSLHCNSHVLLKDVTEFLPMASILLK